MCVFYDRHQMQHAKSIANLLDSIGFNSWVADTDTVENWRAEFMSTLAVPNCFGAVVIWSDDATENPIVVEEADSVIRRKLQLVNVILGNAIPPIGFASGPRVLVGDWTGGPEEQPLTAIREKLERLEAAREESKSRIGELVLGTRTLQLPAFIFSVSSFETQISTAKTLELLKVFTPPAILLSAYDVLRTISASPDVTPDQTLLDAVSDCDTAVFLDSGNYEAYRRDDQFWQRSPWVLHEATKRVRCDVIFSHDRIVDLAPGSEADISSIERQIIQDAKRDGEASVRPAKISPIIHAPRLSDGTFAAKYLPEICARVAKQYRPPLIAVAERELGNGILERAGRVHTIRRGLDRLTFKQPLHILGTGNPLSMMILSLAGGDVFDGLEWCRTVVDGETMRLHHFHQFDLFLAQRKRIRDSLIREYLTTQDEVLTAKAKAVLHNLYFFKEFASQLQLAHQQGSLEELFDRYLPGEFSRVSRRIEAMSSQ